MDPVGSDNGIDTARSTRRRFLASGAALGAAVAAGCTERPGDLNSNEGPSGQIAIAGSSTVFPLMSAIAEKFERSAGGVSIDISRTGSGGGFANFFCVGDTDFNNASRAIQEEEKQQCSQNDVEPVELQVATDALTVIVNNEADFVDCVTVEELEAIWGPDAAETWQDVREEWPDAEIERYGAAETSGTFDYFTENIVGEAGAHTDDYQATERDNDIITGVQGSEFAIGYFGFSYYYSNPEAAKALEIDDGSGCVGPSLDTAANGEYTPLSRPLFTYAAKDSLAENHIAEFARFVVEQSGNQQLVADDVGYVPLTDEQVAEQQEHLETAIDDARN